MKTVNALLDDVRRRHRLSSERQLAKFMAWEPSKLRNYRKRRSAPADRECIRLADVLGIEPGYVLAMAYFQREREPKVRATWLKMARFFERES